MMSQAQEDALKMLDAVGLAADRIKRDLEKCVPDTKSDEAEKRRIENVLAFIRIRRAMAAVRSPCAIDRLPSLPEDRAV